MAENTIIITGNLTADPELKFTNSGVAFASFTIASTPKVFDKNANEWADGETTFLRATVWRDMAENVAASLMKGTRVVATGKLRQRNYETKDGEKRTTFELQVDDLGISIRFAKATSTRSQSTPESWAGVGVVESIGGVELDEAPF